MGISCISSYRGAQLFEIIGLNSNVIDLCFRNNISRIEGAGFSDIESDLRINKEYSMKVSDGIGRAAYSSSPQMANIMITILMS